MTDLNEFRSEVRAWLEDNCPQSMRAPVMSEDDVCWGGKNFTFKSEDQKSWLNKMAEKGWTVPTWPKEYGGGGLTREEAKILKTEMHRINAREPLLSFGIWMLGPALLKFGTEEQKLEYLPPISRGEVRWCQGYSEPNSGSDLASLATKAEIDGDHYVVNGQKVWTSYADQADWIFCLVRTGPQEPKHTGISFILFDMTSEGVSTKPIKLISGKSPFCETFFDDVRVPRSQTVYVENKGWDVAKYLLTHERTNIGDLGNMVPLSNIAKEEMGLDQNGQLNDLMLRQDIASHEIDGLSFMMTMQRTMDRAKAGEGVGAFSSALKYYGTELNKDRHEFMLKIKGSDALEWEGQSSMDGKTAKDWLRTKANSIEGGTSEVMLNIISKRLLELPDE
ncbi:acyl-CoA dehydrogenase family protein [Temperatibacter marinus]|uniref:Acyl-CoA dehydrogenase family protein n=1 Tax=Temperatibacter marinus TaxID=1456591 RepID=A0AA52H8Q9_9PROT|nr:acyl-CoA dehydrogenase family protein [Temperatibacter marinus]WND01717.1 acyl-CoA dehydrogenase family protein [Temperatibacter marinus]